jgi:hypothetical protein
LFKIKPLPVDPNTKKIMKNINLKFDLAFKHRGGRLLKIPEINRLINIKATVKSARNYILPKYKTLPNIHGDFIANLCLNASATEYENGYFIGLNIGTYFLLADMFEKMFSNKDVFIKIGNSRKETAEKQTINAIENDGLLTYDYPNDLLTITIKNPVRSCFCNLYMTMAIRFLINHELGHIVNGHLGYYKNIYGNIYWNEFNYDKSENKIEPNISQTLEMDADSFATNIAFNHGKEIVDNISSVDYPYRLFYKDLKTYLSNWIICIYCFFKLCGFSNFNYSLTKNNSHPPPSIRVSLILNNVAILLLHNKIPDHEEILRSMTLAIKEAEEAFSMVTFADNNTTIFAANHLLATQYVHDITHNWNNVYPLIKPYAFGYLPPML